MTVLWHSIRPPRVQVAVTGPQPQGRLSVLVRAILVIPHFVVLSFLWIAALVVAFLGWWGALFLGRLPDFAASYLTGFVRWSARVEAYAALLTDVYPPFTLDDVPDYPVRVATTRERLNRWAVFFRFILGIPASIVSSVLNYGAFTIVAFIAWLIALVTGKIPVALHLAYTTAFRYNVRNYCYLNLLTPAYPWWGLFGDEDIAVTQPAPGYPAPGYDQTGEDAQPGYAQPGEDAQPGGYGPPPTADDPAGWRLILTPAAKRLVIVFIVLGVLGYVGQAVVQSTAVGSFGSKADNAAKATAANRTLEAAGDKLNSQLGQFQSANDACGSNLSCVEAADAKAADYFSEFGNAARAATMPSDATATVGKVYSDCIKIASDYTQLSHAADASQYESLAKGSSLRADSGQFDKDANALQSILSKDMSSY